MPRVSQSEFCYLISVSQTRGSGKLILWMNSFKTLDLDPTYVEPTKTCPLNVNMQFIKCKSAIKLAFYTYYDRCWYISNLIQQQDPTSNEYWLSYLALKSSDVRQLSARALDMTYNENHFLATVGKSNTSSLYCCILHLLSNIQY